jgi:hypothetical protein
MTSESFNRAVFERPIFGVREPRLFL